MSIDLIPTSDNPDEGAAVPEPVNNQTEEDPKDKFTRRSTT